MSAEIIQSAFLQAFQEHHPSRISYTIYHLTHRNHSAESLALYDEVAAISCDKSADDLCLEILDLVREAFLKNNARRWQDSNTRYFEKTIDTASGEQHLHGYKQLRKTKGCFEQAALQGLAAIPANLLSPSVEQVREHLYKQLQVVLSTRKQSMLVFYQNKSSDHSVYDNPDEMNNRKEYTDRLIKFKP